MTFWHGFVSAGALWIGFDIVRFILAHKRECMERKFQGLWSAVDSQGKQIEGIWAHILAEKMQHD